jgi:Raf kinase inhibitor-like YbhB/YbcL family protein
VKLTSPAFANADRIPDRFTCEGDDVSPLLEWTGVPENAVSLALVIEDPDAAVRAFTHWTAWGIEPGSGRLEEGERAPFEGRNDFGDTGYRGPCPPVGRGPHRYFFRLYALDSELELESGKSRRSVDDALDGRILETTELLGIYERK